jgi:hypothetical protein
MDTVTYAHIDYKFFTVNFINKPLIKNVEEN